MSVQIECPSCGRVFADHAEKYVAEGDIYECPSCSATIAIQMNYEDAPSEDEAEEEEQKDKEASNEV
jgi:C4-type Zn-finger protein